MTGFPGLDRFLHDEPLDAGCAQAMELLHVYAELAGRDPLTARSAYPAIAAHLRRCGPCAEDLDGLLAAIAGAPSDE